MNALLETLTEFSHRYGRPDYVLGGGGNTSAKNETALWIKPSGTALENLRAGDFVALDRARLNALFAETPPQEPSAREAFVMERMRAAMTADSPSGRPSVETLLHEAFDATYVVHTHPATVNGLCCAEGGEAACAELFPDALWIPYTDPGYTLSFNVREAMRAYAAAHGAQPRAVMLQNHGVFVAGETAAAVDEAYGRIMGTLAEHYARHGVATALPREPVDEADFADELAALHGTLGKDAACHAAASGFTPAAGPLSPDHIVYAGSYPFADALTPEALARYRQKRGSTPRVVVTEAATLGLGPTEKTATLALAFAHDGARVAQLAGVFGGARYLGDAARAFIETWEAESYRQRVAGGGAA